jgi:hypothetical protein
MLSIVHLDKKTSHSVNGKLLSSPHNLAGGGIGQNTQYKR